MVDTTAPSVHLPEFVTAISTIPLLWSVIFPTDRIRVPTSSPLCVQPRLGRACSPSAHAPHTTPKIVASFTPLPETAAVSTSHQLPAAVFSFTSTACRCPFRSLLLRPIKRIVESLCALLHPSPFRALPCSASRAAAPIVPGSRTQGRSRTKGPPLQAL
jgi:hypothetical protein